MIERLCSGGLPRPRSSLNRQQILQNAPPCLGKIAPGSSLPPKSSLESTGAHLGNRVAFLSHLFADRCAAGLEHERMYRITLECFDVPTPAGEEAARDITEACRLHYPHEHNVTCTFVDGKLRLVAENDYDPEGLNLMDEFSDNICAYIEPSTAT